MWAPFCEEIKLSQENNSIKTRRQKGRNALNLRKNIVQGGLSLIAATIYWIWFIERLLR